MIAQEKGIENPDLLVQCALLPDIIEDTGNSHFDYHILLTPGRQHDSP